MRNCDISIYASTESLQEIGAFEALQAGHLQALQVYIHPDQESRDKVLERYIFTISYDETSSDRRTPTGLELQSPGNGRATVQATSNSLQALLRDLAELRSVLPVLPGIFSSHKWRMQEAQLT